METRRQCKVWDDRPVVCRCYDCEKDTRLEPLENGKLLSQLPKFKGRLRVVVGISVTNADDKYIILPMIEVKGKKSEEVVSIAIVGDEASVASNVMRQVVKKLEDGIRDVLSAYPNETD